MFSIREATNNDVPSLVALAKAPFAADWRADIFQQSLQSNGICFLIESALEQQALGFVTADDMFDAVEITNIAVHSSKQGQGLGRQLLQAVKQYAKQQDIGKIWLEVREDNVGARRFYERQGFKEVGRRENYYRDQQGAIAAILLTCWLY